MLFLVFLALAPGSSYGQDKSARVHQPKVVSTATKPVIQAQPDEDYDDQHKPNTAAVAKASPKSSENYLVVDLKSNIDNSVAQENPNPAKQEKFAARLAAKFPYATLLKTSSPGVYVFKLNAKREAAGMSKELGKTMKTYYENERTLPGRLSGLNVSLSTK